MSVDGRMPTNGQVTETGSVTQVGTDLEGFGEQVRNRLLRIQGEVGNLAITHHGLGAGAFQTCMGNWDETAKQAVKAVNDLAERVRSGVSGAQTGDKQVADNIVRSTQGGGGVGGGGGMYAGQVGGTYG